LLFSSSFLFAVFFLASVIRAAASFAAIDRRNLWLVSGYACVKHHIYVFIMSNHVMLYRVVPVIEQSVFDPDIKEESIQESGVDPELETSYPDHQGKPRMHLNPFYKVYNFSYEMLH